MDKQIEIQYIDGVFVIKDETDGGYVDRTKAHSYQKWETVWSADLVLLTLKLDDKDAIGLLEDKTDYDHHRVKRAKGRHLRALRVHLGLEEQRSLQIKKYLIREKGLADSLTPIKAKEGVEKTATIEVLGSFKEILKKRNVYHTEITEENLLLANEYNEKLKEFRDYQKEIFDKLFK